eukprot:s244_g4.t1
MNTYPIYLDHGTLEETLARLRSRSPRTTPKGQAKKKMPPAPDPYELDLGTGVFLTRDAISALRTMNLIMEGETRIEVCFPPLPLADLDWNICDLTETRTLGAGHGEVSRNRGTALKKAQEGAPVQEPDKIKGLLERRFKKKPEGDLGRTAREPKVGNKCSGEVPAISRFSARAA